MDGILWGYLCGAAAETASFFWTRRVDGVGEFTSRRDGAEGRRARR